MNTYTNTHPNQSRRSPLGARWLFAARIARLRVARSRERSITAAVGFTLGLAAIAISPSSAALGLALIACGLALLVATAVTLASAPTDLERHQTGLLGELGSPPPIHRRVAVAQSAILMAPSIIAVELAVAVVRLSSQVHTRPLWAALVGLITVQSARWMAQQPEERSALSSGAAGSSRSANHGARLGVAAVLITAGTLLPAWSTTFSDLNLTLGPGLMMICVALALAAPTVRLGATRLMRGTPLASGRLAGRVANRRGRATDVTLAITMTASLIVVVLSMLGAGFSQRERTRRASLPVKSFTAGLDDNQVIASSGDGVFGLAVPLASGDLAAFKRTHPQAVIGDVQVPTTPGSTDGSDAEATVGTPALDLCTPRGGSRLGSGQVGVATPTLLAALGLERFEGALNSGSVLALDRSVIDSSGKVGLMCKTSEGTSTTPHIALPAVVVSPDRVPTYLPSILVAAPTLVAQGVDPRSFVTVGAVVTLQHRATAEDVAALWSAYPKAQKVAAGSQPDLSRLDATRLDDAAAVLRTANERRAAIAVASLGMLLATLMALRLASLANRRDDDLMVLLGARTRSRRAMKAMQALSVTATGICVGAGIGLGATVTGLTIYNHQGRFSGTILPAIPVAVPPELAALVAVPFVAAAISLVGVGRAADKRSQRGLLERET